MKLLMLLAAVLAAGCTEVSAEPTAENRHGPIIDVHRHASWPGADDGAARADAIAEMDANGIVLSLLYLNEPGDVEGWLENEGGRFIGGPAMPCSVIMSDSRFSPMPLQPIRAWMSPSTCTGSRTFARTIRIHHRGDGVRRNS